MGLVESQTVPAPTVVEFNQARDDFEQLLLEQAEIHRKAQGAIVLSGDHVRRGFRHLMTATRPGFWSVFGSHTFELVGGGLATYGWHWGEVHAQPGDSFTSLSMIAGGALLCVAGISIREFLLKSR